MLLPSHFRKVHRCTTGVVCSLPLACFSTINVLGKLTKSVHLTKNLAPLYSFKQISPLVWLTTVTQTLEPQEEGSRHTTTVSYCLQQHNWFGLKWSHNHDHALFIKLSNLTPTQWREQISKVLVFVVSPLLISFSVNKKIHFVPTDLSVSLF